MFLHVSFKQEFKLLNKNTIENNKLMVILIISLVGRLGADVRIFGHKSD